jgi:protein arginine N-methyltransferase 1
MDFHRSMLVDETRMRAFQDAIAATVCPGDVVLDIGAGTGILSFLACRAGASRVYAVERGPVIELAQELAEANGFGDRIVFLPDWSTAIDIPEPADVLVTETIGNAGIDEGIIAWTTDARRRLLRPGGRVVPGRIELWAAAVESWDDHAQVSDWSAPSIPFDYGRARARAQLALWCADFADDELLTTPTLVADVDLHSAQEPGGIDQSGRFMVCRDGVLHGLACWFRAELAEGITLTNVPPTPAPSWGQGFLAIPRPLDVKAGDSLVWQLAVSADGDEWEWWIHRLDA